MLLESYRFYNYPQLNLRCYTKILYQMGMSQMNANDPDSFADTWVRSPRRRQTFRH